MKLRVYVASSWRNERQQAIVRLCKDMGFKVYDFKNPENGKPFAWSACAENGKDWKTWTLEEYREALNHPLAEEGYESDMTALSDADIVILVFPAGVSAALEFGFAVGAAKFTAVIGMPREPDLMIKMADFYAYDEEDLRQWLSQFTK